MQQPASGQRAFRSEMVRDVKVRKMGEGGREGLRIWVIIQCVEDHDVERRMGFKKRQGGKMGWRRIIKQEGKEYVGGEGKEKVHHDGREETAITG